MKCKEERVQVYLYSLLYYMLHIELKKDINMFSIIIMIINVNQYKETLLQQ